MTETLSIGIIGYGYWGPNMVRNFYAQSGCTIKMVADVRDERLAIVRKTYPAIETVRDASEIIKNTAIDAIVIATPVFTHYPLAKAALEAGKHILVEKPFVSKVSDGEELIDIAIQKKKVIMVDHTFLYTGAVNKIKSLIDDGVIGKVNYVDSTRINLGLFQPDINVLWDLAAHDISILNYLVPDKPCSVQATGISHTKNGIENIAYLTVKYPSDLIAHFSCSWSSPVKIRKFLIGGDKKMIVYDDMEPTEKIKVYDTGVDYKTDEDKRNILVDYRVGDIYVPKVPLQEALAGVAKDFIDSITTGKAIRSDHISGINVVKVLEAAQVSIKNNGKEVAIKYA